MDQKQAFINGLPLLEVEARRLGLFITARAINNVVRASGWELAGDTEKAAKYAPDTDSV